MLTQHTLQHCLNSCSNRGIFHSIRLISSKETWLSRAIYRSKSEALSLHKQSISKHWWHMLLLGESGSVLHLPLILPMVRQIGLTWFNKKAGSQMEQWLPAFLTTFYSCFKFHLQSTFYKSRSKSLFRFVNLCFNICLENILWHTPCWNSCEIQGGFFTRTPQFQFQKENREAANHCLY